MLPGLAATRVFGAHAASAEEPAKRLRAGELGAIAEIYDQHQQGVRAFARRLLGDDGAAEDLVHDVFVALPAAMQRYEGGPLRAYLLSIAVNLARRHVRTAIQRRKAAARIQADASACPPASPPCEVERRQLADQLHRALDALPLDQRAAFVLVVVEERTSKEASEIAGVPEGTIRTRVFHARRRLQEILRKRGVR
jgi:RNA polymerase sigma-70 factor (ECF subfamily)